MKKTILAALIAATALAPFSAVAQEWQGRRGNRGGERAEGQPARPQPQARPDGGFNREAFRANREALRANREAFRDNGGGERPNLDREAFRARREALRTNGDANRRFSRPDQPIGAVNPPRPGSNERQGFRPDRGLARDDNAPRRFGQNNDRRGDWDRGNDRDGRPDWNRGDRERRPDWNGNNRRGWNGDRRPGWNRGDNRWNRGWRSDSRYNWQDWRGRNRNIYRLPRYYAPRGYHYGYQRFGIGVTLGSILFSQNYWINDPWQYRLPPADGPFRWVRYYNDALLVDLDTGEVVDVIYDIFW